MQLRLVLIRGRGVSGFKTRLLSQKANGWLIIRTPRNTNMRILAVFFLTVLGGVSQLAAQHGRYLNDSRNPAIGDPAAIAAGAKAYSTSCAGCHGPDGSGGRGPNLVRRVLWHPLSDEDIFRTIRNGVPGADMPPTILPDDQTWNLVAFIHSLIGPASENKVAGNPEADERIFRGSAAG